MRDRLLLLVLLSFLLSPVLLSPAGASAAVLAAYPFDDGTANDTSGNGHHGDLLGDPVFGPGVVGSALRLDGQGDSVSVASATALETGSVALSLWLRPATPLAGGVEVLSKRAGAVGYSLRLGPKGLTFQVRDPVGVVTTRAIFTPVVDRWVSVVVGYAGNTARLYVDGILEDSASSAGALAFATSGPLVMAPAGQFDGSLDEVRVGAGSLSPERACTLAQKRWDAASLSCIEAFTDVTADLGLDDTAHVHFGATLVDIDDDGWIDLYYVNGGSNPVSTPTPGGPCPSLDPPPTFLPSAVNMLFMNQGDGTFTGDVAAAAGIDDFWNAMRHAWGDYDNDGRRDMFSHNFLLSSLYRVVSHPAPLVFEDASEDVGLRVCLRRGTGVSWVDVDNNGRLDLYAVEYDPTRLAVDHVSKLFLDDGLGGFVDVTAAAGLDLPDNPMGQAFGDYDNDGDQDVFVTNSHEVPSRLYRNDGPDLGTGIPQFNDVAAAAGVALIGEPSRGIGAAWGDYNNDGRLDLLFSREADSRIFRNDGPGPGGVWTFTDVTGVGGLDLAAPENRFWGGNFADLDNDGWLDAVFTNREHPGGPNKVFFNNRDGTWREVGVLLGMDRPTDAGMGFVPGDIDNDGDLDMVLIAHLAGQRNSVWRNESRGNNWVQFRLTGTASNRDAVGARIEVTARLRNGEGLTTQLREVTAGTGFFSDVPRIQTFGLAKADRLRAVVRWPSGAVQNLGQIAPNQRYDVTEP